MRAKPTKMSRAISLLKAKPHSGSSTYFFTSEESRLSHSKPVGPPKGLLKSLKRPAHTAESPSGSLRTASNGRREFGSGDAFFIPKGFVGSWITMEPSAKHFVI